MTIYFIALDSTGQALGRSLVGAETVEVEVMDSARCETSIKEVGDVLPFLSLLCPKLLSSCEQSIQYRILFGLLHSVPWAGVPCPAAAQ